MNVHPTSRNFKNNAKEQLANEDLQAALNKARGHFVDGRSTAAGNLPEFEDLRDQARDIKNHTIENLDFYLEAYEEKVVENGGHVHWARTAEDARRIVLEICRSVDAKAVNKGKSMIGEECEINEMLEANGIQSYEELAAVIFTVTEDLTSAFPAEAARQIGMHRVPLLSAREVPVPGSLPRVIRVLALWNTDTPQDRVRHVYLREAVRLRPDLESAQ